MRDDYFNPDTYEIIDKITGEDVNQKMFIQKVKAGYWEKAYASVLSDYIGVTGSNNNKILGYLLKNKTSENIIHETIRGISEELHVSTATISTLFRLLKKKKLLKKIKNGRYMLSPSMIGHGDHYRGVLMFKLWGDIS
jgi:hypothetical protein